MTNRSALASAKKMIRLIQKELRLETKISKQELDYVKKHLDKIWEHVSTADVRLQDLEVQVNLLSRLVAALAVEKLGMKTFGLLKLIKRIEKEVIADNQIRHLEDLYKLEQPKGKKSEGKKD